MKLEIYFSIVYDQLPRRKLFIRSLPIGNPSESSRRRAPSSIAAEIIYESVLTFPNSNALKLERFSILVVPGLWLELMFVIGGNPAGFINLCCSSSAWFIIFAGGFTPCATIWLGPISWPPPVVWFQLMLFTVWRPGLGAMINGGWRRCWRCSI